MTRKSIRSAFCLAVLVVSSLCRAAVTVEDAYSWSGGQKNLEHYGGNAASFASISTTHSVPSGAGDDECLLIAGATGSAVEGWNGWPQSTPASDSTYTHIGFWLSINNPDTVTITDPVFFCFGPNDGDLANSDICLGLDSGGGGSEHTFHIIDSTGTQVTSDADTFEDDTWYWVDLFYQRKDSGTAHVYVSTVAGGQTLVDISGLVDFNDGSASGGHAITLDSQRGPAIPFGGQSTFAFKNLVIEYGIVTVPTDGVFKVASLVSNAYKVGTTSDNGDNLNAGDWDDVSDSSAATHGDFNATFSGGIVTDDATSPGIIGPKDQFGSGVTVLGAKWAVFARNTGTAGLGGVYYGRWDGFTYTVSNRVHSTCATQCNVSYFEAAGGTYIPDETSEWFVIGGRNSNAISGVLWMREVRTWMFTSYPHDEEAGSPWHHRAQMGN